VTKAPRSEHGDEQAGDDPPTEPDRRRSIVELAHDDAERADAQVRLVEETCVGRRRRVSPPY